LTGGSCLRLAHEMLRRQPSLLSVSLLIQQTTEKVSLYDMLLKKATKTLKGRLTLSETILAMYGSLKDSSTDNGKKSELLNQGKKKQMDNGERKTSGGSSVGEEKSNDNSSSSSSSSSSMASLEMLVEQLKKRETCIPQEKEIIFDDNRKRGGSSSRTSSRNIRGGNKQQPKNTDKYVVIYSSGVNVRTGPELSTTKVRTMYSGEYFYVNKETKPVIIPRGDKRIQLHGKQ
jgi:hypothetical protein